jgi:LCP family protein required for cell wall assembly
MSGNEFWEQDITKVNCNKSWFGCLSPQRKIAFSLVLLFVLVWGFFVGFQIAQAQVPDKDQWHLLTADRLNEIEQNETLKIEGMRTILIIGSDTRDGYEVGRTDTIMLAFINGDAEEVSLLSIPRDTYVQLAGYSTRTKINHAYAYGKESLTKSTIEQFLGITIDDHVVVDFNGFVDLVDAMDGVEINVDQRMINYDEKINLNPGLQTLDGKQALGYCRFRIGQDGTETISDIKRAEHQQTFIIALKDKLFSLSTVWKVPKLVTLANKNLDSSIAVSEAIKLGNALMNMDLSNIKTYTIPTYSMWIGNVSYEIVNRAGTLEILDQIIGDEYDYTPNIIDDAGQGRYSAPDNAVEEEEEAPDLELEDGTIVNPNQPGGTEPSEPNQPDDNGNIPQPGDPGYVEPLPEDPGTGGGGNIPEPQ